MIRSRTEQFLYMVYTFLEKTTVKENKHKRIVVETREVENEMQEIEIGAQNEIWSRLYRRLSEKSDTLNGVDSAAVERQERVRSVNVRVGRVKQCRIAPQIVTSYITVQPDLSSTLTSTTTGDAAPVGPSDKPGWSGNGAIDGLYICLPQPTSGPPPSAPMKREMPTGSSLMQHELRDGDDDGDDDVQPACPIDNDPNQGNPGGSEPPGQGPGQKSTGIQPPPAVTQWIQGMLLTAQLAWMTVSQVMSWMSQCISHRKAMTSDKPCGSCHKQPANAEPDCQDEKALTDTSGNSDNLKASTTDLKDADIADFYWESRGGRDVLMIGYISNNML